jgi:preprotein translocase SecE subunit
MRGGPAPAAGGADGGKVVQPSVNRAQATRMREMMAPSAGGQRVRIEPQRLGGDFIRESWAELGKVHWPTRIQARNLTALVIGVSIFVGIVLGGIDFIFAKLFQLILGT